MASDDSKFQRIDAAICLALGAMIALCYWPVLGHDFINFDDDLYVTNNPVVQAGLTREGGKWAFTTVHAFNWHPLTWLSHMLDCQLFGMSAGWHHAINVLWHIANTVIVFALLVRLTGRRWLSALVAALFAIHPLHVESVAWIAERKDVLSTFFGLLAIWTYVSYVRHRSVRWYGATIVLFALSLMAKPMLVTLPFVLLLIDVWPLQRLNMTTNDSIGGKRVHDWKLLIFDKIPLLIMSVVSSVTTIAAQQAGAAVSSLELIPLHARLGNAIVAYAMYLIKTIIPTGLSAIYPHPLQWPRTSIALSAAMLLAVTLVAAMHRQRRPMLIGWLWFLVTLVPVIGLVQAGRQWMADRYTYVPLIGAFILVAWMIPDLSGSKKALRFVAAALVGAALVALMWCTFAYVRTWADSKAVFSHALTVMEANYIAHNNLGEALLREGRDSEAAVHFERAVAIAPDYLDARANLGLILMTQGHHSEAIVHLRRALRLNDRFPEGHAMLGICLAAQQQLPEARRELSRALELNPQILRARTALGKVVAQTGEYDQAIVLFKEQLQMHPDDAEALEYLRIAEQARTQQLPKR